MTPRPPHLLLLAFLAFLAPEAKASYISVGNQRIDRALYHDHGPREVLSGRIEAIRKRPGDPFDVFPFHRDIHVRVEGVVLGKPERKGSLLRLSAAHFDWPAVLVPFRKDARLILIVRPGEGEEGNDAQILTVVPTSRTDFTPVPTRKAAKRVLADALLAELEDETNAERRRELILQAGCVLEKDDASHLLPFLEAKEAWVRRAAIAVLAYVRREQADIERAAEDLRQFLRSTPADADIADDEVQPAEGHVRYASYPLLFDHYFYLITNWSEEETRSLAPLRLLAHVVATELKGAERMRWLHGVACLCRVGTGEDVDLLWSYLIQVVEDENHPLHGDAYARCSLVEGLSRILRIENKAYLTNVVPLQGDPRTFVSGESEQIDRLRDALRSR